MKKKFRLILTAVIFVGLLVGSSVLAIEVSKTGYLIIWSNFCIVVKSPTRQISGMPGQESLSIILQDKTLLIVRGSYLTIIVPIAQLQQAIQKYHLQALTIIE